MDAATNTAEFAPVFIGISPAGVEWVAYRPEAVAPMTDRLAVLKARAAAKAAPTPEQIAALRQLKARGTDRYGDNKIKQGQDGRLFAQFRYAGSRRDFAELVRQAGGEVLALASAGKTRNVDGACNNPLFLTFTVSDIAADYLMGRCNLAAVKAR